VFSLILTIGIELGALKLSANNINRNYIVRDKQKILYWSLGYIIGINGIILFFRGVPLSGLLNILVVAATYFIATPKFLRESTQDEILSIDQNPAIVKESGAQIGKGILKVALVTIAAFILLILILVVVVRST